MPGLNDGNPTYNDKLDANRQVSMEEEIARIIFFDCQDIEGGPREEYCQKMGREILDLVLAEFRPDLFSEPDGATANIRFTGEASSTLDRMIGEITNYQVGVTTIKGETFDVVIDQDQEGHDWNGCFFARRVVDGETDQQLGPRELFDLFGTGGGPGEAVLVDSIVVY